MLTVNLICSGTGKVKDTYYREAWAEYEKRLSAYCKLKNIEVGESDDDIINAIPKRSYVIALCVNGKQLSSEELAKKIEDLEVQGKSEITLIIGPSEGFGKRVEDQADFKLSFSKMTFPHRLMRVILLEQLYRAMNINAGGKYHK